MREGPQHDVAIAIEWFQKALAQGGKFGRQRTEDALADMYSNGEGVPKHLVLAYAWANLAARDGSVFGELKRHSIEIIMTASQINEAQRLSSSWKQGQLLAREGR